MNKRVVVDASALLPAILPQERLQAHADTLVDAHVRGRVTLCAPPLLAHEILNALFLAVRGKPGMPARMTLESAQEGWALFTALGIDLVPIEELGSRVLALAMDLQRPSAYDMSHVALAEKLETSLVTADERLLNAVRPRFPFVRALWDAADGWS